jgi:chorismate lyase / 3-hydroxybenzoate synthase
MQQGHTVLFGGSFSASEFLQQAAQQKVLGALCFTSDPDVARSIKAQSKVPCLHVPMKNLGNGEPICESWFGKSLQQATVGDIHYQFNDDVLFGVLQLKESSFTATENKTPLQQAAESAYRQIFQLTDQMNYPHIFRFWNYMADINDDSDTLERYRQFNLGRHEAFLACQRDVAGNVPAACALGFKQAEDASFSMAFLAGRVQPIAIENPRQISAYEYPEQYGPVSPTFSRATLVKLQGGELLLISGTASIVGHATQHGSDAAIQARESIINIAAVLEEANRVTDQATFELQDLHYRVYVRYPEHVAAIQAELMQYTGGLSNIEYLHADICRKDLLLEIEASAEYHAPATST